MLGSQASPAFGGVVFTNLYAFTNGVDGAAPLAALAPGPDGSLYGVASSGGSADNGAVFKISTNGVLTTLHSFTNTDGTAPSAALAPGTNGYLYGTAFSGGTNGGYGTVFEVATNGAVRRLYCFDFTNGAYPQGSLVQGGDGWFYGTTFSGGSNAYGTVIKISTNGALTLLHSFDFANGAYPRASLAVGQDGAFYGTASGGGTYNVGSVFRIAPNGAFTNLHSFLSTDGANPYAGLTLGSDGYFYGTTYQGGTGGGNGTVFRIATNGALTSLHSFTGGNDGAFPDAVLALGSDGNLYGTTSGGGTNYGSGTIFRMTTAGVLTTLYTFTGGNDGASPGAGLVMGGDGSFYGTTSLGGPNQYGTVFRLQSPFQGAAPSFQSFRQTGQTLTLIWSTVPQQKYQLQYSGNVAATVWTNLGAVIIPLGNTATNADAVASQGSRFYRIAVVP